MYLWWLEKFPESMVQQQQQQHRVSWGGWGGPNYYVDTRVEVELGWGWGWAVSTLISCI